MLLTIVPNDLSYKFPQFFILQILDKNYNGKSSTELTIRAYRYKKEATLNKIIEAIYKIPRNDILARIKDNVYELLEQDFIPADTRHSKQLDIPFELRTIKRRLVKAKNKENNQYDQCVFLTFSSKNYEMAQKVAEYLRQDFDGKKIYVLMLDEHKNIINDNWSKNINKFFEISKYIIPILTNDYFKELKCNNSDSFDNGSIDSKYLKYIFKKMKDDYMERFNCNNRQVRSIIFDYDHDVVDHRQRKKNLDIFGAWYWFSNIDQLVRLILNDNHP